MTSSSSGSLRNSISTDERFARSANLIFDFSNDSGLPDYKFTRKSIELLTEILECAEGTRRDRAWSIVGAYGSGKSIFSLLLLKILSSTSTDWVNRSLSQLALVDPELAESVNVKYLLQSDGYIPVIVQGSTSSLDYELCSALMTATSYPPDKPAWASEQFIDSIRTAMDTTSAGVANTKSVMDLYRRAIALAKDAGYKGIVLVIDEFGKFLENAAWQGSVSEVITSQYIAELASSFPDPDFMYFTILHQGMNNYVSALSEQEWNEWTKIQGRFRNVEFVQDEEGLYQLIASSLNYSDSVDRESVKAWADRVWSQVSDFPYFDTKVNRSTWPKMLEQVYPFHPLSLYALPRLSRSLSQNERTLFSFLGSEDPLGFKRFLDKTPSAVDHLPSLPLDYLFDYFGSDRGIMSLMPEIQRTISETENALERVSGGPHIQSRIVKIFGVLELLRAGSSIPANIDVLSASLDAVNDDEIKDIEGALNDLLTRKILIYRKFSDEYRLWQGSDFDFEGHISSAKDEIRESLDISSILKDELGMRAIPARRHSIDTGAVRAFTTDFHVGEWARERGDTELGSTDHRIVFVLPSTRIQLSNSKRSVLDCGNDQRVFVVPENPVVVTELAVELSALKKVVRDNTDLQDDPVALKEMSGRIQASEDILRLELESLIEPRSGQAKWYWQGKERDIRTRKDLQELLSSICDVVYHKTPAIPNELINRDHLTSPMVLGLKKLVSALINHEDEEYLGLIGNGPEVSVYRALVFKNGLHRADKRGKWKFYKPSNKYTDKGVSSVLKNIEQFLKAADSKSRDFQSLYDQLADPPFGVKPGLVPLLIWLSLRLNRDSVSIYENGTFQKDWSAELFDRFIKSPKDFTVRWLEIRNTDTLSLINKLAMGIPNTTYTEDASGGGLPKLLQAIFAWYQVLPDYTKRTLNLSSSALQMRQTLMTNSDPIDLVFFAFPTALGISQQDIGSSGIQANKEEAAKDNFVASFKDILYEIENSYTALLKELLAVMYDAFDTQHSVEALQSFYSETYHNLDEFIYDPMVKALLLRARETETERQTWLESIAATLANQAPRYWMDHHREEFKDKLAQVTLAIRDAEKRRYAKSLSTTEEGASLIRVTVEGQDIQLSELYLSSDDQVAEVTELAERNLYSMSEINNSLTKKEKQRILLRALSLLSEGEI